MGNIIDTLIINIKQVQERIDKHAVSNLRHDKSLEENRAHITSIQQELLSLEHNDNKSTLLATNGINREQPRDTIDTVKNITKRGTRELVIIGSSIVKFVDAKKIERRKAEETETICIPGGKTSHVLQKVKTLKDTHDIKKMIIHVGGNHIPHESPDTVIANLQNMLTKIKTIMPNTKIYYSFVLPRINDNYIPGINEINLGIIRFCEENGISVIHHSDFGNNGSINCHLFRKDIIHPNSKGISTFARDLIYTYRNYNTQYSPHR